MRYFGFKKRSFGLKTIGWAGSTASALADLFKNGEQGVWLDPSDLSTMFQDVDGTVPVTKDGEPVALIKDKSGNNNHAYQAIASARPIYRTDGILHWLAFDGVDDQLNFSKNVTLPNSSLDLTTAYKLLDKGNWPSLVSSTESNAGVMQFFTADSVGRRVSVAIEGGARVVQTTMATPINTPKIRSTHYNISTGIIKDTENDADTISFSVPAGSKVVVPQGGYTIAKTTGGSFTKVQIFGLLYISSNIDRNKKDVLDIYMANKAGLPL